MLWAVLSDAWGYSKHFLTGLPNGWNQYLYGYISRLIWVSPFLFLAVREKPQKAIPPKQLFGFHLHWKSLLTALAASTIYVLCGMLFIHGGWWINPGIIIPQELFKFFIVGFVEELVYRGYGLNLLSTFMSGKRANIISSLFFAALHIPAYFIHWYRGQVFLLGVMLTQVTGSFILGLIFGVVFQKSRSVWASAAVHFWYDFSFVLFIGSV